MLAQQALELARAPEGLKQPHLAYDKLRQIAPIYRDTESGMIYLLRWADCDHVLRAPHFTAPHLLEHDPRFGDSSSLQFLAGTLSNLDPPDHTRLRGEIQKSFSVPVLRKSEAFLSELVSRKIAELRDKAQFDVVSEYAADIPSSVICALLGVPQKDRDIFGGWLSDQFRLLGPGPHPDELVKEVDASTSALLEYMGALIEERRAKPQLDIISGLVASQDQADEPMSAKEMAITSSILLAGGSDSSRTSIAMGTKLLLENRDQLAEYLSDIKARPTGFEEILRLGGPVVLSNLRRATQDCEVGGMSIAKDDLLVPVLASANIDPEKFADPLRFDIKRKPNQHLAFGAGIHVCVGNMLARMVAPKAISALLEAYPDMQLVEGGEVNSSTMALRSLSNMMVEKPV